VWKQQIAHHITLLGELSDMHKDKGLLFIRKAFLWDFFLEELVGRFSLNTCHREEKKKGNKMKF